MGSTLSKPGTPAGDAEREEEKRIKAQMEAAVRSMGYAYEDPNSAAKDFGKQWEDAFQERHDMFDGTQENWLYGGKAGAADADVARYQSMGRDAAGRTATGGDYAQADLARALGMQSRGDQSGAIGLYRDAAMGKGPSAAQSQFAMALDQAQRAQMSGAASARGGALARAAAQRGAMNNAADMTQNAASASAALRAQEMQAAMQGYAGYSGQQRGQDIGMMGSEAEIVARNRAQNDAARLAYEQLGQSTRSMELSGNNAMERARQDRYMTGEAQNRADIQAQKDRDAARDEKMIAGAGSIAGTVIGAAASSKGGGGEKTGSTSAGLTTAPPVPPVPVASSERDTSSEDDDPYRPKVTSDRRAKTDVRDGGGKVQSFLDALNASDYRYKAGEHERGGRHTSVMAQDLEKSELGRRMVDPGPRGKEVDYGEGLATMLAASAHLNDRVNELEEALKARHGKKA